MWRLLMLMLATTLVADVASDNEFDGLFDKAAGQEQDPSREALRRLFDKYGARDGGRITFEGFEHLLESLGLGHITIADHDVHDHQSDDGRFHTLHDSHVHNDVPQQPDHHEEHADVDTDHRRITSHDHQGRHTRSTDDSALHQSTENGTNISQCLTPVKILHMFHIDDDDDASDISQLDFVHMCPTIVYQLDAHLCHPEIHVGCHAESINRRQHCRSYHGLLDADRHQQRHSERRHASPSFTDLTVWGSATVAVTAISLVGLAAVAVIPVMSHRAFYDHLLHFLVAVAIATLTGDALLHLLPHALMPHGQHGSHDVNITYVNVTSSDGHRVEEVHDGDTKEAMDHAKESLEMVWKGLVVLAGIYAFFVTERLISLCRTSRRRRNKKTDGRISAVGQRLSSRHDKASNDAHNAESDCTEDGAHGCLERRTLNAEDSIVEEGQSLRHHHHDHHQDHNHRHHHHHDHHSHSLPSSSVASAAWMVIMGDGLHNFTDGLAIGAAFANGIAGGIGTTTAVFCHELPHELGDFAVLLRSGMTVKQAITYNMVSSVLAFAGMCLGVVVGTLHGNASSWVFALTAGIFIYVSLVDMLPEITRDADDSTRSKCFSLILDIVGLSIGVALMSFIAFHEERIQLLLTDQ